MNPKFLVVSVAYAPPGNGSSVDYANSSVLGTSFTFGNSFTNATSLTTTNSIMAPFGLGEASIMDTLGWSTKQTNSTSFGLNKTKSADQIVLGPTGVGLDHSADQYYVWLDPIYDVSVGFNTSTFTWSNLHYVASDPYGLDIAPYSGTLLSNPSTQSPGTAQRLSRYWDSTLGGINNTDYQTILNRNPFVVNANYDPTVPDPATGALRFQLLQNNPVNYVPAAAGTQPVTTKESIGYVASQSASNGVTDTYSTSVTLKGTAGFLAKLNTSLTQSSSLEMTHTLNRNSSQGETASLTVVPPGSSANYQGTTAFGLFQDNVYGTFMFYPIQPGRPIHHQDVGATTTSNPAALQTSGGTATVNAVSTRTAYYNQNSPGKCVWAGFGNGMTSASETLFVNYGFSGSSAGQSSATNQWNGSASIQLSMNGGTTWSTIANPAGNGQATATIPAGTDLSQVQVAVSASVNYSGTNGAAVVNVPLSLMLIQ